MKRAIVFTSVCLFLCSLSSTVAVAAEYIITEDLKFWVEKLQGGGPGQAGNVLQAVGDDFTFNNARLSGGYWKNGSIKDFTYNHVTTYLGGDLSLGPNGPWYALTQTRETLKARNVTATNYNNITDPNPFHNVNFYLTIEGQFFTKKGVGYNVLVEVTYGPADPEVKYENGTPVFQKGSSFNSAKITITPIPIP